MEENIIEATVVQNGDASVSNGIRRSFRSKRVPQKYDEEHLPPSRKPSQTNGTARSERPKRRTAQAAREQIVPEDVFSLHEQIFARMDIDERKEYHGWVELESEPAFFNAMLQFLGAKTLNVQEVFALDQETLADLPQPVYGFVFLEGWTNEDESNEDRQDCPENLWFGNQTTTNACATVALMNIIMNVYAVEIGAELEEFRNKTRLLPPPHRGHALDTNDFIRAIHNSVARRSDLLNEDLLLENKFADASKRKKAPPKKKKRASKFNFDPGSYHYIAFVPVDGQVWELDGLESMPLCLGTYQSDDWLEIASEAIMNHMGRQNNDFLRFNLLAICQSPLLTLSQKLATSLVTAKTLDDMVTGSAAWDVPTPWADFPDSRLTRFDLTQEEILTQHTPHASFDTRVNNPSFDMAAAKDFARELRNEQEQLEQQYISEEATIAEAVEKFRARGQDYTPAIHHWVRILAEKGVLHQLIQETDKIS